MFEELRRIVTGHNAQGRSCIVFDGPPPARTGTDVGGLFELWATDGGPIDSTDDIDRGDYDPVVLSPPPGGSKFRYFAIAPTPPDMPREQLEAATAAVFEQIGAAHERVDTTKHPAMHKTKTIDYIILLRGQVRLLLDDDEVDIKPFDVVVQRGTNHAWVVTGDEPALFIAVLIDTEIGE